MPDPVVEIVHAVFTVILTLSTTSLASAILEGQQNIVMRTLNKVKQKIVNQRDFTYPKQTFENHFKEIFQYCKDNNLIETIKSGNFDYSTMYGMFPDKKNTDASLDWIRYKYVPPKQVVLTSEGDDAPF